MATFTKKRGTVGWPGPQAKAIAKACQSMGLGTHASTASTGTIYLTVDDDVVVRVADHGECYCSEDVSCDPTGLSVAETIRWIAARFDKPIPASVVAAEQNAADRAQIAANRIAAAKVAEAKATAARVESLSADVLRYVTQTTTGYAIDVPAGTIGRKEIERSFLAAVRGF